MGNVKIEKYVGESLAHYKQVTDNDKHSSLLRYLIKYNFNRLDSSGPCDQNNKFFGYN
jgi:hypothetical protein